MLAELRGLNEECGVFGIWGNPNPAHLSYYGLHALQHRGQEGAGIVVSDGQHLRAVKGEGLVNDVFNEDKLKAVNGKAAIAHVRYTTAGGGGIENVQPLLFHSSTGSLSIAHNGNLVNATHLKQYLERQGSIFHSSSDTEVLAHLIKKSSHSPFRAKVKNALSLLKGAYSFLIMTKDEMLVARDPHGLRPLSLGKLGDGWVVASETCAFDLIGAEFVRSVEPGELIIINDEGVKSDRFADMDKRSMCAMEYVYLARPDSDIDGINVHMARKRMGKQLARECAHIEADVVTGVPDSSISAAIGFAEESGIPYELGLIKNRYVGRTFIQPTQELRERGVKMKLSPVVQVVKGKKVVMVDDSIVRGTTSRRIVKMLKDAGAAEVHVVISSPPMTNPCYYGIDTSTHEELIASSHNVDEIREAIGADSLTFLSVEGMVETIARPYEDENRGLCLACFTGKYPTEIFPDTILPHEKELLR
ncbi:amidophosphoribosyltransferase [Lysinibacillus sp. HST-98]|uniref:Amidophosphoribosyltransferase n=1 Tax=Lysinibacillus boronitolerans JCM 21713 = 10a = NBRC 103108 TaxID=1294264 RepID=A0ABR4Y0J4_9BACI|nr:MULTISPECIES: amidophosphoribosyltransferase [Lysinibacillus]EFI69927.1 amidophosphoribosyltransferase precursor [Lysinibacillus fusiformis ZC1]EKU40585.1 amidophosphoribosyltransferase precursor [Lysinibacillus fusiformis ZB2]KGR86544.1 amidophosphoribosyltransferase [Lysinibacillus boronitolerans JCM 21713 = 10a = NBRC 103108]MBL3731970.1 amidophosphoribosyltransferase [Lysinibacillus sp. HST-98]MBU5254358.1 amidophosphoribosyltransferase [Lysinibacillus capsici]